MRVNLPSLMSKQDREKLTFKEKLKKLDLKIKRAESELESKRNIRVIIIVGGIVIGLAIYSVYN